MRIEHTAIVLVLGLLACGDDATPANPDAGADGAVPDAPAAPDAPGPGELAYGERCGNASDDDADGLADEDCEPSLFTGLFAPRVSADPQLAELEAATQRPIAVLQTYHSTSALGVERTGPDLAAIFARGQVPHLNIEPDAYTRAQLAAPTTNPLASDLAAMGSTIAASLVAAPSGRLLLTFGAEMNGAWTEWGCLPAAQYHALYRAAYTTITAALDAAVVDRRRVRWVYGPDSRGSGSCATGAAYYPGHTYVDLLGLSAYRADTESVATTVTGPLSLLFAGANIAPAWQRDRFVLLQTGSRPVADRDAWIAGLYSDLAADPRVAGVIYFDASADWAIPTAGAGWSGWTTAIAAAPIADARLDGVFTPHFWDVAYSDEAFPEIQALADAGVTTGCGTAPPRFCPADILDRRAAAQLIARAFTLPAGSTTPVFSDVPATDPAFAAIQSLVAAGATTGCGGGAFCPDTPITEEQLAAILVALGGMDLPAASPTPSTRARAAILLARAARLTPQPL